MGIHPWRRQHMGAVHRHTLSLVDGRRIAVVDPVIVLEFEANGSVIVGLHDHRLRADLLDGPERAVLHAQPALILQEHDAIPAGKVARAALDGDAHVIAKCSRLPHPFARCLVERSHLVIGVGEDDAALIRR